SHWVDSFRDGVAIGRHWGGSRSTQGSVKKQKAADPSRPAFFQRVIVRRGGIARRLNSTFANLIYLYHFDLDSSISYIATKRVHEFDPRWAAFTFRRIDAEVGKCMR